MRMHFSDAAHAFLLVNGMAEQFAAVAKHGIPAGSSLAGADLAERFRSSFADVAEYETLRAASDKWWGEVLEAAAVDVAAASVLIFKHSALDVLLNSLCRIIGAVAWETIAERKLSQRTFKLAEVLDEANKWASISECVQKFVKADVCKSSVMQKIEFLFEFASPVPDNPDAYGKLKYDPDRLKAIDGRRHDAVHKGKVSGMAKHQDADSEYIFETGMLMLLRFSRATGLAILDPKSPVKP